MAITVQSPPDARPEFIAGLVSRLNEGDIKLPVFQRQFVWKAEQVVDLLDSVYRGYPIGSLLFWRTEQRMAEERNLGGFELPPTREKYPHNYVLDGQQRLTSLFGALTYSDDAVDHPFAVDFDLRTDRFVPRTSGTSSTCVPMNCLLDTNKFLDVTRRLKEEYGDELVDKAQILWRTFNEYAIPVVTIMQPQIDDVATIFERINSTGTRLTLFDLMIAATWSSQFDLRDEVEAALDDLRLKRFDSVSPVAVLQVLAAHVGASAKRSAILDLRDKDAGELTSRMSEVREALRAAVDFLSTELRVVSDDFLPYERQLVALAYVFARQPRLGSAQASTLRQWFWRTSFSERYRRGGEGLLDEDLLVVFDALSAPAQLARFGRGATAEQLAFSQFRRGSAMSAAFVAMLAGLAPLNLLTGTAIDTTEALAAYNRKEFHHIFPQAYLAERGVKPAEINSLANICMLRADENKQIGRRPPSVYVVEMEKAHGAGGLAKVLASNAIPIDALEPLKADDFQSFCRIRSQHLSTLVEKAI